MTTMTNMPKTRSRDLRSASHWLSQALVAVLAAATTLAASARAS
jgi:hypothetical protein